MSENILLGWPNRIDEATLSLGSWPSLTLTNLQIVDEPWRVARSATDATADTKVRVTLPQARSIFLLGITNHNLSLNALFRFRGGTTAGAFDVYDSGWQGAWAMTFDSEMLEWEATNWWEGIADDEYIRHPWALVWPLRAYYNARYWDIEIDDTTNPDGYVQLGRIFIGGGLQPTYNPEFGLEDSWVDPTTVDEGISGNESFDRQRRRRQVEFQLGWMTTEDEKRLYEMRRRQGISGEVFYVPDPSDLAESQLKGFLARQVELPGHRYLDPELRASRVVLRERV